MAYQPPVADVTVVVTVAGDGNNSIPSERRITPSWSVNVLKGKLETMTGIPPSSQRLKLKVPGRGDIWVDDEMRTIGEFGLVRGAELEIHDLRPPSARPNFSDLSSVEKYTLPPEQYEQLQDSVLSWKKSQKLGRFNPDAPTPEEQVREQVAKDKAAIEKNNITLGARAIIVPSVPPHLRRGTIRYIEPPLWVGIELDEPTGKNNGSVGGKKYFECLQNRGVFVKPDKVEVGDWPVLGLDDLDEDMEEI
ncbi:Cytoskeleton-associated protein, Gly-rich domain protein [Ascosphaera apis ARSEF 7405]|uniref:Cytoskeleton-associated protein, Gly-rich domain protein n=1 Tax=Ascosphaera apis ARSEF 7405 TaxID=392613 RepID=A0A162ISM0_9EURO|nr:Cytoskeleton-associated protein, Gly-rich domain protein [Ascosphaera apis ARSEF 7405]